MSLHCAATRPKFLNKPCDLLTRDTWESNTTIFNDFFVLSRLLSSTLVSTSCGGLPSVRLVVALGVCWLLVSEYRLTAADHTTCQLLAALCVWLCCLLGLHLHSCQNLVSRSPQQVSWKSAVVQWHNVRFYLALVEVLLHEALYLAREPSRKLGRIDCRSSLAGTCQIPQFTHFT